MNQNYRCQSAGAELIIIALTKEIPRARLAGSGMLYVVAGYVVAGMLTDSV